MPSLMVGLVDVLDRHTRNFHFAHVRTKFGWLEELALVHARTKSGWVEELAALEKYGLT